MHGRDEPFSFNADIAGFSNTSFDNLVKSSGKKMKKTKKKKKKASTKEEADFGELKKSSKRKRSRLELLEVKEPDLQVDEDTEDIDVTTPLGGVAPLSVTLKQSLEKDGWLPETGLTKEGLTIPWDGSSKRKNFTKEERPTDLLVSYDLGSLPRMAANAASESLSSPDSPSPTHMCHSKYEGDSIKVIIQRNEGGKKKKKHKKKKSKRHHEEEVVSHRVTVNHPSVDKGENSLPSLKVTINRLDLNMHK